MIDDPNADPVTTQALEQLINSIAHASVRAAHNMGVVFDVDDPRIARWLILATFEGMITPNSTSAPEVLLARAEEASRGEGRIEAHKRSGKAPEKRGLVGWEELVESSARDAGSGLNQ